MQALTTIFTPPAWCLNRFAVAIDNNPFHSSTLSPSRGWVDPSYSQCVPTQYTDSAQTMSPGVCPKFMTIARTLSNVSDGKTIWAGGCCQSGFSDMSMYWCTSTVTTPMAFVLLPNITTTDIYTTLSNMWIEHDQFFVEWQETDLKVLPKEVVTHYASIMGITLTATSTSESSDMSQTSSSASQKVSSAIKTAPSTTPTATVTVHPIDDTPTGSTTESTKTSTTTSKHTSSSTTSNSGPRLSRQAKISLVMWLVFPWLFS